MSYAPARSDCPLCAGIGKPFTLIDGVKYFECVRCDFIYANPELLASVDRGEPLRKYDESYWQAELDAAKDRSYGSSLARFAEVALYSRIPIRRFIDIGTGPGFLLDALGLYLPSHQAKFFGVEKFPPQKEYRSSHPNYRECDLGALEEKFECGLCIEVLEHLTPAMAKSLAAALVKVSVEGSIFLFNTGLTEYVKKEDPQYLDPFGRGHITCWSVKAAEVLFGPYGYQVYALRGKSWAFVLEYSRDRCKVPMEDRIWTASEHNRGLLRDPLMGSAMYILGLESARAY